MTASPKILTLVRRAALGLLSVMIVISSGAMAGAPLKGVDVKLGKKGSEFPKVTAFEITVYATAKGTLSLTLNPSASARKSGQVDAADFLVISSDGRHPISGVVSSGDNPAASLSARSHPRGIVTLIK
jgi:hypothetical protein